MICLIGLIGTSGCPSGASDTEGATVTVTVTGAQDGQIGQTDDVGTERAGTGVVSGSSLGGVVDEKTTSIGAEVTRIGRVADVLVVPTSGVEVTTSAGVEEMVVASGVISGVVSASTSGVDETITTVGVEEIVVSTLAGVMAEVVVSSTFGVEEISTSVTVDGSTRTIVDFVIEKLLVDKNVVVEVKVIGMVEDKEP